MGSLTAEEIRLSTDDRLWTVARENLEWLEKNTECDGRHEVVKGLDSIIEELDYRLKVEAARLEWYKALRNDLYR